jgi:prolipoprotein diacylglyceryl transferase
MFLLEIPSPSDPFIFQFHGLQARWYGLILALAVLLGGWIARKEFRRRGLDPELVYTIAVWTVPAGLIGARLYHVITDWGAFSPGHYSEIPQIWQGGLGIWGAVVGGMIGMLIGVRRAKLPFWVVADCVAPGLVLAQALGRWGNYFNQELYGGPSSKPWAVKIDNPAFPYNLQNGPHTFVPTFLYESIWDVLVFFVLWRFIKRYWSRVPAGTVFALYVALYCLGRLYIETLRIDTADEFFGQRLNVWVALICMIAGATAFLLLFRKRRKTAPPPAARPSPIDATGHVPTPRPEAAIAARRQSQKRKKPT